MHLSPYVYSPSAQGFLLLQKFWVLDPCNILQTSDPTYQIDPDLQDDSTSEDSGFSIDAVQPAAMAQAGAPVLQLPYQTAEGEPASFKYALLCILCPVLCKHAQ